MGDVRIIVNDSLIQVDSLHRLLNVSGDLRITDNVMLARCCGLYPLLSTGTVGGTINIENNGIFAPSGPGCTQADILNAGPCQLPPTALSPSLKASSELGDAYPNPALNRVLIPFHLASGSDIQFRILDTQGQQVLHLPVGQLPPGEHEVSFDLPLLAEGLYLYQLISGTNIYSKSLIIRKE